MYWQIATFLHDKDKKAWRRVEGRWHIFVTVLKLGRRVRSVVLITLFIGFPHHHHGTTENLPSAEFLNMLTSQPLISPLLPTHSLTPPYDPTHQTELLVKLRLRQSIIGNVTVGTQQSWKKGEEPIGEILRESSWMHSNTTQRQSTSIIHNQIKWQWRPQQKNISMKKPEKMWKCGWQSTSSPGAAAYMSSVGLYDMSSGTMMAWQYALDEVAAAAVDGEQWVTQWHHFLLPSRGLLLLLLLLHLHLLPTSQAQCSNAISILPQHCSASTEMWLHWCCAAF